MAICKLPTSAHKFISVGSKRLIASVNFRCILARKILVIFVYIVVLVLVVTQHSKDFKF